MHKYLRVFIFGISSLITAFSFSSCDKDMSVALQNENIDALNLNTLDSMSVHVSTVKLPSVPTSGQGTILFGRYEREGIGALKSTPYFQVNPTSFDYSDIPLDAQFDSVRLVLRTHASRYYNGDTTQVQQIAVHRLTENLEKTTLTPGGLLNAEVPIYAESASIFGDKKFQVEETPLGTLSYSPRVGLLQSLSVRLEDSFGQDLFDKMKSNATQVSSMDNFVEYMKGFALVPADENTVLIAYNDSLRTELFYSYVGDDGLRKSASKALAISDLTLKYNHMENDFSGTPFEGLNTGTEIAQSVSDGVSFIQSGSGVAAKISIPSLLSLLETPDIALNKAELEIEVEGSPSDPYIIPTESSAPVLFVANSDHIVRSFVSSPLSQTVQYARYEPGNTTGRNGRYYFNLIQYIRQYAQDQSEERSLLLSMAPPALGLTANTVKIATEGNKPKIKLNILYTKFN